MANIDVSSIKVLQSVYDYKVRTKKLKIYSFALFHKCQYRCVEKIKSVLDPENCFQECEKELDEYFDFKKSRLLDKAVFYAIPEYKDGNQQYIIPKEEILEYQNKCILYEQKSKQKYDDLLNFLNNRAKKYKF